MEPREEHCMIPRNLNKTDTILFSPVKMNWKQIVFAGLGAFGGYLTWKLAIPLDFKILLIILSIAMGIITSFLKVEDSTIDELVGDGLNYLQKKNMYNQMEKRNEEIKINFRAKKEA